MVDATTTLSLLYAAVCGALAVGHSVKVGRVTLLDWALLAMGGMYGIGWTLVLHVTILGGNPLWEPWILQFESLYLAINVAAFLLLLGVLLGWYLFAPFLNQHHQRKLVVRKDLGGRWHFVFWILLCSAITMQGLYSLAYGGYLEQLRYSSAIRSATFDAVPANPLSFLKPFAGLAMIAAFGFSGLWLSGQRRFLVNLGALLSFLFSLYVLYSWLGRIGFMVFFVTFPMAAAMYWVRAPLRMLVGGAVVFLIILIGSYSVSVLLGLKGADNFLSFLGKELSFPFVSFFSQLDLGEHLLRGFIDFALAPIFALPSSLWTQWVEPVGQVNTAVIMGAPKGVAGVTGAIPVDLLTLGMMQFNFIGVFISGAIFGLLLRWLQSLLLRISNPGVRAAFEANIALKIAVFGVFYAQPNQVVSGNIHWVVTMLVIFFMSRVPRLVFAK